MSWTFGGPGASAIERMWFRPMSPGSALERQLKLVGLPPSPPLAAIPQPRAFPTNLPAQLTTLIGRDRAVRQVGGLLGAHRLVTLSGPGGIGKTRLAVEVARLALAARAGGAWFVDLAEVSRPEQIAQKVAWVLDQREEAGQELVDTLCERLRFSDALLLMDNCEHVLDPAAQLIARLERDCPTVTILATSRERLGIAGETVWPVPPLSVPNTDADPILERVLEFPSVKLFFERAEASGARLRRKHDAAKVADICRRVDGLPLAIELAAARVRVLAVDQIASRLGDRLALLVGGSRTGPARHVTLRATFVWSYELLSQAERALARRLSVFAGDFSLEAAQQTCAGDDVAPDAVLDLITSLADKSLLLVDSDGDSSRYRLLQTIREFATEKLNQAHESEMIGRRHARHYGALAHEAEPGLLGPAQGTWLDRLDKEHENLRNALVWCLSGGDRAAGRDMASALWRFWYVRGYFSEGRRWLELVIADTDDGNGPARAKALRAAAVMARVQGDYDQARTWLDQALLIYRDAADKAGLAAVLNSLGTLFAAQGYFEEARQIHTGEALALYRELGDLRGIATCLQNTGNATRALRDYPATKSLCLESLAIYRQIGFGEGEAASLMNLGLAAQACGETSEARRRFLDSLDIFLKLGYREGVAQSLEALGVLEGSEGRNERAVRLLGAGEALRELLGTPIPFSDEKAEHDNAVEMLKSRLGPGRFAIELALGRSLGIDDAVLYAKQATANSAARAVRPGGLTRRELEVTALVALGLKDRDIAARLHISARTAGKHVEHVRDKLDLRSRAELGAWATRMGVLRPTDDPS